MILDLTTKSIEVKLGAAATTRGMQFYTSYVIIDTINSTTTPTKNIGTTNGTTAVTLVPAPSSNKINELRFCSIHNCDTVTQTVTIQENSSSNLRTVFNVDLQCGDQIQYNVIDGWKVFNMDGIYKTFNSTIGSVGFKSAVNVNANSAGIGQSTSSATTYCHYLGKADRNYDTVTIQLNITTALGATINWAEAAIYKGTPTIGTAGTFSRCGWADVSQGTNYGFNATGTKQIPIPINVNSGDSNINIGDELWFVFAYANNGTQMAIRGTGVYDNIGAGLVQTINVVRPSTNASITFTTINTSTIVTFFGEWMGEQRV